MAETVNVPSCHFGAYVPFRDYPQQAPQIDNKDVSNPQRDLAFLAERDVLCISDG